MSLVDRIALGIRPGAGKGTETRDSGQVLTLDSVFGGMFAQSAESDAGKTVTVGSAIGLGAVYAAIRLRSNSVGSLPFMVYQRQKGGGRVKAWYHPAYRLLHNRPNPEMSPKSCWSLVETHMNTWGNAFLGKQFAPGGRVLQALWPIRPDLVIPRRDLETGRKVYDVTQIDGSVKRHPAGDIIHLFDFSLDGFVGLSPIQVHRATIGMGLALDQLSGSLLKNRGVPSGVLKIKKALTDPKARERVRTEWQKVQGGPGGAGKVAILDEDASFESIMMPLADAQYVEQRKLSVQDIARIFNVPASLIQGSSGDSLTYRTVEGDGIHFLQHSLNPSLVTIEQEIGFDTDLFPELNQAVYPEFERDAWLQTDAKTQAAYFAQALAPGRAWMTPAEVRDLKNLPPDPRFDYVPEVTAAPPPVDAPTDGGPNAADPSQA